MGVFQGAFYYVCPVDGAYSGEMKLARINKTYMVAEMLVLKADSIGQLVGERLKCPKCKKIYGWHQLKRLRRGG